MKKVLYVLLPQFAEHEMPYLTQPLRSDAMAMKENPKYENKIVAESMDPVEAISGFRLLPDYTFNNVPDDYAALVYASPPHNWSCSMPLPVWRTSLRKPLLAIHEAALQMAPTMRPLLIASATRGFTRSAASLFQLYPPMSTSAA